MHYLKWFQHFEGEAGWYRAVNRQNHRLTLVESRQVSTFEINNCFISEPTSGAQKQGCKYLVFIAYLPTFFIYLSWGSCEYFGLPSRSGGNFRNYPHMVLRIRKVLIFVLILVTPRQNTDCIEGTLKPKTHITTCATIYDGIQKMLGAFGYIGTFTYEQVFTQYRVLRTISPYTHRTS